MTAEDFNEKYKQYIPEGWYGLEFDSPVVTDYLDVIMQDLITIPGFELHQIKLKFGMARFYFETNWYNKNLETALQSRIEGKIDYLINKVCI
jgi:hypothetical protein